MGSVLMTRPSRDRTLTDIAGIIAKRSTCSRLQVGAVFSLEGRILVTGYNGAPAGLPHCNHDCDCTTYTPKAPGEDHTTWCQSMQPCTIAEHAERNAIAFAARHGVKLEGAEVHVTHMPCLPCSMSLVNAGVERVIYVEAYRLTEGIELLRQAHVVVDKYWWGV